MFRKIGLVLSTLLLAFGSFFVAVDPAAAETFTVKMGTESNNRSSIISFDVYQSLPLTRDFLCLSRNNFDIWGCVWVILSKYPIDLFDEIDGDKGFGDDIDYAEFG
jgi:hypothetical protein